MDYVEYVVQKTVAKTNVNLKCECFVWCPLLFALRHFVEGFLSCQYVGDLRLTDTDIFIQETVLSVEGFFCFLKRCEAPKLLLFVSFSLRHLMS